MSLVTIKLGKFRPEGFGFNVHDKNGKLIVTQIFPNSVALRKGLYCGDIIYSINNEIVIESAKEFANKIKEIKGKVRLLVHRTDRYSRSQLSYNNLSTLPSDSISAIGPNKMKSSKSSIDLVNHDLNIHMTDGNYVPDEYIDSYMESMSSGDMFDDNTDPLQITRKQAYKKTTSDVVCNASPRYSVKRATKSMSIYSKDPNITIKKRIKPTTMSTKRPPLAACNQTDITENAFDSLDSCSLSPFRNTDENISALISSQLQVTAPDKCPSNDNDKLDALKLDINVKILSFKEKIRKPLWKSFTLEKGGLGVLFHCLEIEEEPMGCNSTAIDPYVSGLDFYMSLWQSNNTVSRYFLPIGQTPFSNDIDMTSTGDSVHIVYKKFEVDFVIDQLKMTEDNVVLLHSLLGLQLVTHDTKANLTKTKRQHANSDNSKLEARRQKSQRFIIDSPRTSMISTLPQSKLIENVPLVVIICVNIIERLGIKDIGIYRKSGNEGQRKNLENVVVNESTETWYNHDEWANVFTVCSLLKSVLRSFGLIDSGTAIKLSMINLSGIDEMGREQVFMDMIYHLRQRLCHSGSGSDRPEKAKTVREMQCRLETFKYIMKHLNRVSRYRQYNMMPVDNLAICFWPTIIEDITCFEDTDYQTSKKSDADKNLMKMVTFWISYADLLCDLLDDDDEVARFRKLASFLEMKDMEESDMLLPYVMDVPDEEAAAVIREMIEYYTSQSFVPIFESRKVMPPRLVTSPSLFRTKTITPITHDRYMRRRSTSLSPRNTRKITAVLMQGFSPMTKKKIDNGLGATDSPSKKRVPVIAPRKDVLLRSHSLFGSMKNVPLIIEVCITIINEHGLDVDGIYRICGRKQDLISLEELVTSDDHNYLSWYHEPFISMWANVYIVSGLLKSVLKRLRLIRKETWVHLVSQFSEKIGHDDLRKVLMKAVYYFRRVTKKRGDGAAGEQSVEDEIRWSTLRYVLLHLKTVTRHVINSRMTSSSLAVCFMPVIMEDDDADDAISFNFKGIQVMEKLIDHCDWIFQWDDTRCEDIGSKAMSDSLDEYLRGYSTKELAKIAQRTDEQFISQHTIDSDTIRALLKRLLSKCHNTSENHTHTRRHSDSTEVEVRKSEVRSQ